jgi:hypothetical protein
MTHPIWPLFDLRVVTPRLELRYIDDELATALSTLAARGVHDPGFMPFSIPWTEVEPPLQQRNTMQYYWPCILVDQLRHARRRHRRGDDRLDGDVVPDAPPVRVGFMARA